MRKFPVCLMLSAFALCLLGCRRDYKVIYARPAIDDSATVDTTALTDTLSDYDPLSGSPSDDMLSDDDEDGLIDIPDIPTEEDVLNPSEESRLEYDDYVHGR